MADQTEQEQIDPIARCIQWLSFMVTNADDRRIVQAELESIRSAHQQETSRLLAALSTVDSQIHQQAELLAQRWDTVERLTKQHNEWKAQAEQHAALLRERDAQIASLSEFRDAVASALCVENPFGEINNAAIVEAADITLSQLFEFSAEMTTLRAERDAAQQEIEREQAATRQQQESASRLAVALAGRVGELLALQRAATGVVAGATEWWRECPWCRRANYQNAPAHFVDCPLEALRAALSADVETERSDFSVHAPTGAAMTARDRDKVIALLKSVAAECEGDQDDHKWRTCRHCLAVEELDRRDIRRLVGEFAATHQQGGHQP